MARNLETNQEDERTPLLASQPRVQSTASASCCILRKLSPVPEGATEPKWGIIVITMLSLSSCVVNITMLFAYLPQMMRDMGYAEQFLGIYAGLVASSYFIGAFFSSNIWGYAADIRGRRPVILICLFGTSVCTLSFGFSFNIYWAVVSRLLVGVFNGIIGTSKAILGDISDDSNQAVGLAILSVGWGSGLLLGPAIGGYLSEPVKKYPGFGVKELRMFESYPYLLPNLLSAFACILVFFVCLIFLPETKNMRSTNSPTKVAPTQTAPVNYTKSLVVVVEAPTPNHSDVDAARPFPVEVNEACLTGTSAVMKSEASENEDRITNAEADQEANSVSLSSMCSILRNHKVAIATALFSIFSFACVALDECIPLWAATKTQFGGLGFTTNQLGTMTGAVNVPCLVINVLVFPKLEKYFGCVRTYCISSMVLFLTTIAIPFINELSDNKFHLWLALIFVLAPNRMTYPICWSAADILINNSVYPQHLGLVNGLSMTFSFLARSASPLAAGSLFSWSISTGYYTLGFPFGHHFTFFVIDVAILSCFFLGMFTPRSLDKQPETWDLMENIPDMKSQDILKRLRQKVVDESREDVEKVACGESDYPSSQILLDVHEAEQRKVRLFNATFSNSLSYQIRNRPRHYCSTGSATEDSSTNASRFHSARENISDDGDSTMHEPRSPDC